MDLCTLTRNLLQGVSGGGSGTSNGSLGFISGSNLDKHKVMNDVGGTIESPGRRWQREPQQELRHFASEQNNGQVQCGGYF